MRTALNVSPPPVITVRDRLGYRLLEDVGVTEEIHLTADPALLLDPEELPLDALKAEGVEFDRPLVGFSVREPGPAAPDIDPEEYYALLANAGHGLRHGFLDHPFEDVRHVLDTNITVTLYQMQKVGREMRTRGQSRILMTGSIAGFMSGTFQAVYSGTQAFLNSFSWALRNELQDTGITVTCLMPGATETEFFARADMLDTKVGQAEKDDPADVAKIGFDAMMEGEGDVVTGLKNKLQTAMANVTPASRLAEQHRTKAEPGSGKR